MTFGTKVAILPCTGVGQVVGTISRGHPTELKLAIVDLVTEAVVAKVDRLREEAKE